MSTPSPDGLTVSVEIERLRGEMATGFAEIKGQLAVIVNSQAENSKDIAELEGRVSRLEERRWPVGSVATLSGFVSAAVAVVAVLLAR